MENTTLLPLPQVTYPNSSDLCVVDSKHHYNENYASQKILQRRLKILSMVIYSLTFVLGVAGNGLVIFITGFRMKKTVNTIWFLSLAIADFTFTLFLPLIIAHVALNLHWPFGETMCKFNNTLVYINLCASVYLLMVISIDRCVSVWCPVWAQNHRTPRLGSFVALGVWILALVLSSPFIHFQQTVQCGNVTYCYTNYGPDDEKRKVTHRAVIISRFIFAFVIPFTVIIVCYGAIVLRLRRDRLAPSSKPFKVITTVIVAFFVCWFPFHVLSLLETKVHDDPMLHLPLLIGIPLAFSLASMNSCLNPILYVFMGHNFKESLKRSFLSVFQNAFAEHPANKDPIVQRAGLPTLMDAADLSFPKLPPSHQDDSVLIASSVHFDSDLDVVKCNNAHCGEWGTES